MRAGEYISLSYMQLQEGQSGREMLSFWYVSTWHPGNADFKVHIPYKVVKAQTLFAFPALLVSLVQAVQGIQKPQMEEGLGKRLSAAIKHSHASV